MSGRAPGPSRPACSERFDLALIVAAIVHRGQVRKGTSVPYVVHPAHVAAILERHGRPEAVVIAGLLHDVVEDLDPSDESVRGALREAFPGALEAPPGAPAGDADGFARRFGAWLRETFGEEVTALVGALTEEKRDADGRPIPWAERKRASLETLADPGLPPAALALKAADVLHNARSIDHDWRVRGAKAMQRFSGTPAETVWYYRRVCGLAEARLGPDDPLAREAREAVEALAARVEPAR